MTTRTKLAAASKGAAWPAPQIWRALAVGIAAANARTNPIMLAGLRAPKEHTTGISIVARSLADG